MEGYAVLNQLTKQLHIVALGFALASGCVMAQTSGNVASVPSNGTDNPPPAAQGNGPANAPGNPFDVIPARDPAPLLQALALDEVSFRDLATGNGRPRFAQLIAQFDAPEGALPVEPRWLAGPRYSCRQVEFADACREYLVALVHVQRQKQERAQGASPR
jgi:hypothetical protein